MRIVEQATKQPNPTKCLGTFGMMMVDTTTEQAPEQIAICMVQLEEMVEGLTGDCNVSL
jgi:hypothetical protein